ncbi:MAG: hypothetical protein RI907_250 [Pseudomonadota bacterium]|jgi:hypothetical protein
MRKLLPLPMLWAVSALGTPATHRTLVPMGGVKLRDYAGQQVKVAGKLFHASTGHHHTPVLLAVTQASPQASRP